MREGNVIAVTFDQIQGFLFRAITEHKQENQRNAETLSKIIGASRTISEVFFERLGLRGSGGLFYSHVKEVLVSCSGMCVFVTELDEAESICLLDELFAEYYREQEGTLLMKYVCFAGNELNSQKGKMEAIIESKKRLKEASCLNNIVSRQQKLLFEFQTVDVTAAGRKIPHDNTGNGRNNYIYKVFAENIDKLREEGNRKEKSRTDGTFGSSEAYFRTVIIKADLDGMGALFKNIKSYHVYKQVSEILNEQVCLKALAEQVINIQSKQSDFKLYPLYVAGDDIMFAVPVSGLRQGIDICGNMLKKINERIRAIDGLEGSGIDGVCTLSIGVELSQNREPIRYYYERVQKQLKEAKKGYKLTVGVRESAVYCKICINERVFYYLGNTGKKKKKEIKEQFEENVPHRDEWKKFMRSIELIKQAEGEGFKSRYYLYQLLNKAELIRYGGNEIACSNALLYHMLPQYINSSNKILRESELMLMQSLIGQFLVRNKDKCKEQSGSKPNINRSGSAKNEPRWKVCFDGNLCIQFRKYIQLLLVFSDERFEISGQRNILHTLDEKQRTKEYRPKEYIRSIFNKTLCYLYEKSLLENLKDSGNEKNDICKMTEIFVRYDSYESKYKKKKVWMYQTLHMSGSLFHRMKNIGLDIEKCGELLANVNPKDEEIYNKQRGECEKERKPLPGLPFEKEKFISTAKSTGLWTSNYIDTLLILYLYNDCFISFKKQYPKGRKERRCKQLVLR